MIRISEDRFDFRVPAGQNPVGSFDVRSDSEERIAGDLFSDHERIVPEVVHFSGRRMRLRFAVNLVGLEQGEAVEGRLYVVTDLGEAAVSVRAEAAGAEEMSADSAEKMPSTLREFALRAEQNPEQAAEIFRRPAFEDVIDRSLKESRRPDRKSEADRLCAVRRGLLGGGSSLAETEEFLIAAGLKEPVTIVPDTQEASYYRIDRTVMESIGIRRSGWGCFSMKVEAVGDFLEVPQKVITEDDFVGSSTKVSFLIRKEKLGSGRRFGKIVLTMPGCVREIRIIASQERRDRQLPRITADRVKTELYEYLICAMLPKTAEGSADAAVTAERALPLIERLRILDPGKKQDLILLQAAVLTEASRFREASEVLREYRDRRYQDTDEEMRLIRIYLESTAAGSTISTTNFAERVRIMAMRSPDHLPILLLAFRTSPDLARFPKRRLKLLRQAFEQGSRSPALYAAALAEFAENDALIVRLDAFAIQVLLFAARHGALTREMALRAAYLSENVRSFSNLIYRILATAYQTWPLDGILEAVVRHLMKGRGLDPHCFSWYEQAVNRGLKVLRLYEYYVETLPPSGRELLPPVIRKYFAFNHTLSEEGQAALYANIFLNRDRDPETFEAYRTDMERFALKELRKGAVTRQHAVLYQGLVRSVPDRAAAETLVRALFSERIYTDDPSIRSACVVHRQMKHVETVDLSHGSAQLHRYTDGGAVLLEDYSGRRLAASVQFAAEPLMRGENLREICRSACPDDPAMLLSAGEEFSAKEIEDAEAFRTWKMIASSSALSDGYRSEARRKMLRYILAHPENTVFSPETGDDQLSDFARADKTTLFEILIRDGLLESAFRLFVRFGSKDVTPDTLYRLCILLLEERNGECSEELLRLAETVFRDGARDPILLRALCRYIKGSLADMRAVRKAAGYLKLPTASLDERILTRIVFTGNLIEEGPDVFRNCVRRGCGRKLIRGYLELYSEHLLGSEEAADPFIASYVRELIEAEEPIDFAMKLVFLRRLSQTEEISAEEEELASRLLTESEQRGLRFAFYQKLPKHLVREYRLDDCVFVEEKADPTDTLSICYRRGHEEAVTTEPLERIFRGIFSKTFTLFYGETLTYSVVREHGDERIESEEQTVTAAFADRNGTGSYQRINAMRMAEERRDAKQLAALIEDYRRARRQAETLFPLS